MFPLTTSAQSAAEEASSNDVPGARRKIIVLGATGSLAKFVIEASKTLEHAELTLFVRDKSRLSDSLASRAEGQNGEPPTLLRRSRKNS